MICMYLHSKMSKLLCKKLPHINYTVYVFIPELQRPWFMPKNAYSQAQTTCHLACLGLSWSQARINFEQSSCPFWYTGKNYWSWEDPEVSLTQDGLVHTSQDGLVLLRYSRRRRSMSLFWDWLDKDQVSLMSTQPATDVRSCACTLTYVLEIVFKTSTKKMACQIMNMKDVKMS